MPSPLNIITACISLQYAPATIKKWVKDLNNWVDTDAWGDYYISFNKIKISQGSSDSIFLFAVTAQFSKNEYNIYKRCPRNFFN